LHKLTENDESLALPGIVLQELRIAHLHGLGIRKDFFVPQEQLRTARQFIVNIKTRCIMKENILHIPYTEDLLLSLKKSREQFEQDARFFLAAKLYELEKISSGKAAGLA